MEGNSKGGSLGEALDDGETEAEGEMLALALGDSLDDGESEGDSDAEGLTEALGLSDALSLLLGETEADGESEGETLGLPTEATERISTTPATLGDELLSVNEPEPTVAIASNT